MSWQQYTELLKILQTYAASAFVAMLTIHILTIFLQWLLKQGKWIIHHKEDLSNSEIILDF